MSMAYDQRGAPPPARASRPGPDITARRTYVVSAIALTMALAVPVADDQNWWVRPAVALAVYVLGVLPVLMRTYVFPRLRRWLLRLLRG
ncbi:hypothetical protein [Streptomyces cyaneofuscatus]|uniref:hypothetical protein n=1 Tax=Streptomyces cyaneofuscatus TaxID=66883 RepID=UPI0037951791